MNRNSKYAALSLMGLMLAGLMQSAQAQNREDRDHGDRHAGPRAEAPRAEAPRGAQAPRAEPRAAGRAHVEVPRGDGPRAPGRPPDAGRPAVTYRPPGAFRPGRETDGRGQVLDSRYHHGHYYPPLGTVRPSLPQDYRPYYRDRNRYYFSGGIWYAPRGPGFAVVLPPPGLVISTLPPYYSTVWIGGNPYYYANNVYYTWQPDQSGYSVVDPPENADESTPPPDSNGAQDDLIIYPKNGQTADQQAADRYECHSWSQKQTGFDPTQPDGGMSSDEADRGRSNYNRAMSACLQARGYEVK
jgi:hypothetical protein